MSATVLVAWGPGEVRGILLEDDMPVELLVERERQGSLVDGVFLGRIERVVPSLPGAFVALGLDRPAFLPGTVALTEGSALLVQVTKDARDDKPPEVTRALSLAGSLAAWVPGRPGLAVSRQIEAAERARLAGLGASLIEAGEGVVLRTQAAGASAAALAADIARLRREYRALLALAETRRAPGRLDTVPGPVERLLARLDGAALEAVLLDDAAAAQAARAWYAGRPTPRIAHEAGLAGCDVEAVFDAALLPRVGLPGGAEIIIESGAALTMIDVNLAGAAEGRGRAAETILAVNKAAARAAAYQLRLRNIAGAIVIDFVSMTGKAHRHEVETVLKQAVAGDSSSVEVHGWTRLGHIEVTRRRRAASLADIMLTPGPARRAHTPRSIALAVLRRLARAPVRPGPITLHLDASVEAELRGDLAEAFGQAVARAGRKVVLEIAAGDPERFEIAGI